MHQVSGSSDTGVYVWNVERPEMAPYVLHGHEGEVGAVDWCPTDFDSLATTGDDCTVRGRVKTSPLTAQCPPLYSDSILQGPPPHIVQEEVLHHTVY